MRDAKWGVVLVALALSACDAPGVRGVGTADVAIGESTVWTGQCEYSVLTRWSTRLPHLLELREEDGNASIVLQARRRWSPGEHTLSPGQNESMLGRVMDGSTVEGAVSGALMVRATDDSMDVEIVGSIIGRESRSLEARCRLLLDDD